jgi:hypothetical protein
MIVQSMPYPGVSVGSFAPYFANDGATTPLIGNASYPAGFYDSTGNKTWVAWEGWNGSARTAVVEVFDHATGRWGDPVTVATNPLVDDDHGVPVLCMDHEGYVHCFYGAHGSAVKYSVTTNVRDPSAWTAKTDIGTDLTYPHPVLVGSALYLFCRGNANQSWVRYKTTALSSGSATWGSQQRLVDFTGGRFYFADAILVGTKIHIAAAYSDSGDTVRRDIYHFVYDTGDEGVENSDNSVNTAVGSQPMAKATADASYLVIDQTTNVSDNPALCRTSDGTLHLAYIDDTTASPYDIKYVNYTSSWSAPVTVTTTAGSTINGYIEAIALVPRADNSVELWYPDDTGTLSQGGDMKRIIRSAGGVWGDASTIQAAGTYGLARPTNVRDHDESLFVLFSEVAAGPANTGAGQLKIYAYGAGGFVIPTFATGRLTPSGDMQSGSDFLLPSGDMDSGSDKLLFAERTA